MNDTTIKVLLADDQAMVRGALAAMLGLEPDIDVVAQVGTGDDVGPAAERTKPDVALLDVQMPGLDGLAAAAALRDSLPSCRVVVLTTFGRPGYLARAMRAGAAGFRRQGQPAGAAGRGGAAGPRRAAGGRPGVGGGVVEHRREPAHRTGA